MPPRLTGLYWTEEAERHVEEHIDSTLVDEMILDGRDYFVFPNTEGHPANRWRFIGRTPSGLRVTAILAEPTLDNPGQWRPITGWMSTDFEREMYERERRRLARKQGGRHG